MVGITPKAKDHEDLGLTASRFVDVAGLPWEQSAGDFVWRPPGSRHQTWSPEGCLVLGIFQVPNKFFEQDGRVTDIMEQEWDEAWGGAGNLNAAGMREAV